MYDFRSILHLSWYLKCKTLWHFPTIISKVPELHTTCFKRKQKKDPSAEKFTFSVVEEQK